MKPLIAVLHNQSKNKLKDIIKAYPENEMLFINYKFHGKDSKYLLQGNRLSSFLVIGDAPEYLVQYAQNQVR